MECVLVQSPGPSSFPRHHHQPRSVGLAPSPPAFLLPEIVGHILKVNWNRFCCDGLCPPQDSCECPGIFQNQGLSLKVWRCCRSQLGEGGRGEGPSTHTACRPCCETAPPACWPPSSGLVPGMGVRGPTAVPCWPSAGPSAARVCGLQNHQRNAKVCGLPGTTAEPRLWATSHRTQAQRAASLPPGHRPH